MSRHIPSLRGWIESRWASCFADECKALIDKEINFALFTGVIADMTSDVSNHDQLTIAIRYISKEGNTMRTSSGDEKSHR